MFRAISNLIENVRYLARIDLPRALGILRQRSILLRRKVQYFDPGWSRLRRAWVPDDRLHCSRAMDALRVASNLVRVLDGSYCLVINEAMHNTAVARTMLVRLQSGDRRLTRCIESTDLEDARLVRASTKLTCIVRSIRSLWKGPMEQDFSFVAGLQSKARYDIRRDKTWRSRAARDTRSTAYGYKLATRARGKKGRTVIRKAKASR